MIFAVDVHYGTNSAVAAAILFQSWQTDTVAHTLTKTIAPIAPYEPGQFYKRELPCIMALLDDLNQVTMPLTTIVVDGYVTLGSQGKAGLGMVLYEAIGRTTPVIGVAKRFFHETPAECELLRGGSQNPLYVTAVGIPLPTAKQHIHQMHGDHRFPTLLKKVDHLCRGFI